MTDINKDLCRRFEALQSDRAVVQQTWDAIETFVTPYRGRFFNDQRDEGSIEWFRTREVYDSTAVMSHQNLAASLHGALTSPSIKWFDIRFRSEELNKSKAARKWLQECSDLVYYALQDSNFNLQINEAYQDMAGFGTAFMVQEEADGASNQWDGVEFHSVPLKEGFFEQDAGGNVLRFYRRLEWTPQQIISKFGSKVPQAVIDQEKAGNTSKRVVLFCIYPRHNKITPIGEKLYPSRRPWQFRYIDKDSGEALGTPGGYYEMPAFAARWRITSSSVWGNSPAMLAMGDILTLNEARKMQLVAAEKLIDPPIIAEERAIITDLNLNAASLTVVRNVDGIKPFNTEGSIPISDHMIDQLQAAIRHYFFADQLNMPQPQAQPITATEAQIRYELMQRLLGPTLGRLQNDLLNPIVERTFRMLARAGKTPDPPQIVIDEKAQFDIEYLGALVRAQRTDNAAAIERMIGMAGNMAPVMPALLDSIDPNAVMQHLARDLNVPADVLLDEREVKLKQDERDAQMAAMQAAEQGQMEGDAAQSQAQAQEAMPQ